MLRAALFAAAMVEACVAFAPGLPRYCPCAAPAQPARNAGGAPGAPNARDRTPAIGAQRALGVQAPCAPVLAYGVVVDARGCSAVPPNVPVRSSCAP